MKYLGKLIWPVVVSLLAVLGWWLCRHATFPIFQPDGLIAAQQKTLFIFTLALSAIVVVPVFGLLIFIAIRYREDNTKAKYTPNYARNGKLEALYWGIPIVIILILSTVTWVTSHTLDPYAKIPSKNKTLEIQVVALEWKWLFIYPDQHIATVNQITVPINTPLHFDISADAPMSAFWIPELGSQIYAMNGMDSQLNLMATKKSTYTGYNTNINGEGYANMTFQVHSVDQAQFVTWQKTIQGAKPTFTASTYNQLMKSSVMTRPMAYRLEDSDIFNQVIMKYMDPEMSSPINHVSTAMPGMNM